MTTTTSRHRLTSNLMLKGEPTVRMFGGKVFAIDAAASELVTFLLSHS